MKEIVEIYGNGIIAVISTVLIIGLLIKILLSGFPEMISDMAGKLL